MRRRSAAGLGYHARMDDAPTPDPDRAPDPERPLLLLASQSPRRRRLLGWLGVPFAATSVDTPEDLDDPRASDPQSLAAILAGDKALAARDAGAIGDGAGKAAQAGRETAPSAGVLPILAFDTIVVHEGEVLGKPADLDDAWRMLRSLSGKTHRVVTGCAVLCPGDDEPLTFSVTTDVAMKRLSDDDIEDWMAHGTFMGCAGAYNIEGQVAEVTVDECYQNVAGLPLCHIFARLAAPDGPECLRGLLRSPAEACESALERCCRLADRVGGREPSADAE